MAGTRMAREKWREKGREEGKKCGSNDGGKRREERWWEKIAGQTVAGNCLRATLAGETVLAVASGVRVAAQRLILPAGRDTFPSRGPDATAGRTGEGPSPAT